MVSFGFRSVVSALSSFLSYIYRYRYGWDAPSARGNKGSNFFRGTRGLNRDIFGRENTGGLHVGPCADPPTVLAAL
jgi:hypothetical protein